MRKLCFGRQSNFFKNVDENYKRVFVEGMTTEMKLEVQTLHRHNNYGHNRLYGLCKQLYFSIPRLLIREVCAECNICAQAQPIKREI
ncbi:hypothetical protein AAJ76_1020009752 [Vairimorpha ceranae]|uniref:Integrase zinc-binding domain-containing protein n=1 Tax=Vairimorpha ceranae TaxID=40302 RepID=A0A0F9YNB7_9MICR|nr:hypothetical protein AAJ76_1020009752 [Vairimorpha ceranae]KKO74202.1 hypothetical protein AAJ76_1020009752 [Vairimorpha ceranae]